LADELSTYYASYSNDSQAASAGGAGSRFPWLRKLFHAISGDVDPRDFVKIGEGTRVLDYGCGPASYLADFHHKGVNISGAEIATDVVNACRAKGFDVRKVEDVHRIPFADAEFDLVYLMQVFEHLRDPHGFMHELSRVLKPSGMLYLALPNRRSVWRKIFGKNWVSGWFTPFHLFHYDRDSLERIARQHGFEAIAAWSRTPESWFRLNLKATIYPNDMSLDSRRCWLDIGMVRLLSMLILRIIELPVRQRDCLVVEFVRLS